MTLDVSLRLLRAFVAVAESGHVGRAAQRLYVSQPSLSQDIRRLEKAVHVPLFVRTPRGMELTPSGSALLAGVRSGLLSVDRAATQAATIGGMASRSVSVAFTPSIGNRLMPNLIPLLLRSMPAVAVDEREVDTGEVGPGVREGRFDLGFAHCPDDDGDLRLSFLADERTCVAVAADSPLSQRSAVSVADLAGLDMLVWPRETAPSYYDHLQGICASAGFAPRVVQGPRRAIIRAYLLTARSTFCLLPASTSVLNVPGIAFVDVADEHATIPLYAVRRADDDRADVVAIERIARDQCDDLLVA